MDDNHKAVNEQSVPAPVVEKPHHRRRTMLVRYGKMSFLGLFPHNEKEIPAKATHVVCKTDRGLEICEIISPYFHQRGSCSISLEKIEHYCQSCSSDYPISRKGKVVRFATEQDLNEQRHLERNTVEKQDFCQQLIEKHNLPMELVDVEHLYGGERIIYYFMADGRVDFRDLVKELAHEYQTRIEMRQVGARDEAKLIADYETCGRECCCRNFLKVLLPVNMRMAKLQKTTLDPSKISGRCSRLKCCLRYEDEVYSELKRALPRNNTLVLTPLGPGTVMETQIITQLVKIRLKDERIIALRVDEITDLNYDPSKESDAAPVPGKSQQKPEMTAEEQTTVVSEQVTAPPEQKPRKKRRRRRKKKKNTGDSS